MTEPRNARLKLRVRIEKLPLVQAFHITGYTFTEFEMLIVELDDGEVCGRGEGIGVYYRRDTPSTMQPQIEALRDVIESGVTCEQLLDLLPAGGARNALDCAFWDLEAKRQGQPVWQLLGMQAPRPLLTTFTVGADDPEVMADEARKLLDARAIKIKLTNDDGNAERVRAVRAARPDVWLMADANQGFTPDSLAAAMPAFVEAGVAVVEQPFPVGQEAWLDGLDSPIPIAADESVQDHHDLPKLEGRVKVINIKLDKCGGLTEAMRLANAARERGFELMVGNMGGSSWSMAPAFVVGAMCSVVDLDGPVFISADRTPSVSYRDGRIWCPDSVWGGPATAVA
ncbi:dipeptide epimerase [Dyella jejuensis]|uniref:Dipeptide epimerase n=1 Tax=Dyella jejuensis TaxID=1432009 RepID=A0ABW8JIV6_9GAMM